MTENKIMHFFHETKDSIRQIGRQVESVVVPVNRTELVGLIALGGAVVDALKHKRYKGNALIGAVGLMLAVNQAGSRTERPAPIQFVPYEVESSAQESLLAEAYQS